MAKYSTGGSSSAGDGDTCELCGSPSDSLSEVEVEGARLQVCSSCAPHDEGGGDGSGDGSRDDGSEDRQRRAVQNAAKANDVWQSDSSRWESEGTNYDDDQLPYLVNGYGDVVVEARQEAGLQREELAEELGVREQDILAVEQGRANQAGVGGSLIIALEDRLDVELSKSA